MPRQILPRVLELLAVLCVFCAPLFVNLGAGDLQGDEPIYAYAVDRMLETRDWLTPRLIPFDGPFLEKPPLKFWIVAGAIRAGWLPRDEFGYRFFDAMFGAVAFVYVFVLGRRLAGPVAGFVALLVLVTCHPLLLIHGLRTGNMDAALFLWYCGGMYHFVQWVESRPSPRRSMHAVAVAGYFTLGFMTKFVAVLFLPLVCASALAWREDAWQRIRSGWRDWAVPALLILAATAPWFIYQAMHAGSALWYTMIGEHVYTRFTTSLDVQHLQPWHFYFSQTWSELAVAGSLLISTAGMGMLVVSAWRGQPWLARLLVLWWIIPISLMSLGTSKLFHYAYPFLPPIALGAGAAAAALFRAVHLRLALKTSAAATSFARAAERRLGRALVAGSRSAGRAMRESPVRHVMLALAVFALAFSVWTAEVGPIRWELAGLELRSSSVWRPALVGITVLCLAGYSSRAVAMMAIALVLPLSGYPRLLEAAMTPRSSLRTLRDCIAMNARSPDVHVYPRYEQLLDHAPFYYLRQVGPLIEHRGSPKNDEFERRLFGPGQQTLMLVFSRDYASFAEQTKKESPGLTFSPQLLILTPGPFEGCADRSGGGIAEGGRLGDIPAPRPAK